MRVTSNDIRCESVAWTEHDDPNRPPNPPAPRCFLEEGHEERHEGRSIPHGKWLMWDKTDGRVTVAPVQPRAS